MGDSLEPVEIVTSAISKFNPVAIRVGFSGGRDSLAITHWMMNNFPGCKVFHCNTGIGVEATREYVRQTCKEFGWPLIEIRAKEDCGMDYDSIVLEHGFPGPDGHQYMYSRLKERSIRKMVRDAKKGHPRSSKVLIATGIRKDESHRRARYVGREINLVGGQLWVNPIYWWDISTRDRYIALNKLPINPISELLGMSGECLCGAFAHKGEKQLVKIVCPSTAARIDELEKQCLKKGMFWGWEGKPPAGGHNSRQIFMPLCVGCEK